MSYLYRDKGGRYFYRRVIPAELRPVMPAPFTGKTNWKRALGTADPATAKKTFAKVQAQCEADFEEARRRLSGAPSGSTTGTAKAATSLLSFSTADIEAETYRRVLASDLTFRQEGDHRAYQDPEERTKWDRLTPIRPHARGMAKDLAHAYGEELEMLEADYAEALAAQNISVIEAELLLLLREKGISLNREGTEFYQAGLAMLRGKRRAYADLRRRHQGDIVETPAPAPSKGPKLSEALELWAKGAEAKGGKEIRPQTINEARYAVRRFREVHGDLPLGAIAKPLVRSFRDMLKALPVRLSNEEKRKPLPELVKGSGVETSAATTVNKYLNLLSAIFTHAKKDGHLDALPSADNPFASMQLAVGKTGREGRRQPFAQEDLAAIFGADIFKAGARPIAGGEEASFWFPLIGLLSGARLSEIAQLRVMDLAQDRESQTWFFDIGTGGGRRVKNDGSVRKVPVHFHLIALGLIEYRQWRLDSGASLSDPLFPGITSSVEDQVAAAWTKWFGRWLRVKAGIEDKRKVFHSFRHTFKDLARDAGIAEDLHDALTGHSDSSASRGYGLGAGLDRLKQAIDSIPPPPPIKAVPAWKPPAPGTVRRRVPKRKLVPRVPNAGAGRAKRRSS
ncbi:MAG: integrase [Beijerinckiaceae bacterium]|nr:integrase [Beijerinckiaceae bacterium]